MYNWTTYIVVIMSKSVNANSCYIMISGFW